MSQWVDWLFMATAVLLWLAALMYAQQIIDPRWRDRDDEQEWYRDEQDGLDDEEPDPLR